MKPIHYLTVIIILTFTTCKTKVENNTTVEKPNLIFHKSKLERKKNAPFSDAVTAGKTLYLAGQIGINPKTSKLVDGGITEETKQVLENIKEVLEHHGSDLEHVVKCTVILSDLNDFSAFNEVFRTYFPKNKPARTTFAGDLLVGCKIEIDVIAVKIDEFKDARVN